MEKPCCESHGNTTDKEKKGPGIYFFQGGQKPQKQATVSSLHVCDIKLMIPGE